MVNSTPTKICRKTVEGYSEIIDHRSSADLDKAMYDFIHKKKSRIECKWLILLLGVVVIIGGLCCLTYKTYIIFINSNADPIGISERQSDTSTSNSSNLTNSNYTLMPMLEHDRKKRNISNETNGDGEDKNSEYLFEQFGHLNSNFGEFLRAFKKVYFSNSEPQPVSYPKERDNELQSKAITVHDENINTSESMLRHDIKKRNISNETEIDNRFSKLYPYFNDLYNQHEKFNLSFEAFMRAFKEYFPGKLPPFSSLKERRDIELQNRVTTVHENIKITNPDTSTVVTHLDMSDKNVSESENGTSAAESYTTNEPTIPIRNSNSSVPEPHLIDASMPDTGTPPVPTTIVTDTERQNQSKNHLSNRDVTTSLYSENTVNHSLSNGENAVGDDTATNSITDEISSTASIHIQQIDTSVADTSKTENAEILDTSTIADNMEESHIMKIPSNLPSEVAQTTVEPITDSNFKYTTLESIQVNESNNLKENNNQNISEILKIVEQNPQPNGISSKIGSIIKTFELPSNKKRSFRNVDHSENPWKLYCSRKVLNSEGKIETRIISVPINESDLHNLPHIKFRKSDNLPPYTAHSLETHQLFAEYSKNKSISNNTAEFFDKLYNSSEVFSFPGHGGGEGSYYCTYSKSFRNAENEKNYELESEIKSMLMKQISLKELEHAFCNNNERMCANERQCVKSSDWCNGIINCPDSSDEMNCSCKERTYVSKICDGYFDCPNGEDEIGCFGCSENEFSCDDWSKWQPNATCVPMSKRCDGFHNCVNGKDELDCELLADEIFSHDTFLVSYTSGYLHRNWKGKWYPVCVDENSESSKKACENELGVKNLRNINVNMKPISGPYDGQFLTMAKSHFLLTDQCVMVNSAVYVDCPAEYCGTRKGYNNDKLQYRYRRHLNNTEGNITSSKFLQALVGQLFLDKNTKNKFGDRHKRDLIKKENQNISILSEVIMDMDTSNKRKRRGEETEERVVGGEVSGPGFWPWVIALYKNGVFHCGGVILNEKWIMTAAHCVHDYRNNYFELQAGILRRLSFSPMEQNRVVSHVIVHTQYSRTDMKNDIALLRVNPPLKLNRWIRPICLPESRPPWGPAPGTKCTAVGWGATREHGPDPDNMREVEVPILSMCKHEADREGDEICAGYAVGGHDTCQGDSGGPLLCPISHNKDRWFVGGIVSHGEGCARPMEPGAYTRIALYLPWLVKNADDEHLSTDHQTVLECPGMKCADGGRCIAKRKICDNVIDCLNGEDEANCKSMFRSTEEFKNLDEKNEPFSQGLNDLMNSTHQNLTMKSTITNETSTLVPKSINYSSSHLKWLQQVHIGTSEDDSGHIDKFTCKIIEQILPKVWQCDGQVDCEDGTDEMNCTCADQLLSVNRSLLCNNIIDCDDLTDEINYCPQQTCTVNEFRCYKSKTCINKTQQCDGKIDCANGEDEKNCYALAENAMSFDLFNVPKFSIKGNAMINENGTWKFLCTSEVSRKKSDDICLHLGFKRADTTEKVKIFGICSDYGIEMNCTSHRDDSEILPWHAKIYINGEKRCTGLLLNRQWIITNHNCYHHYNSRSDHIVAVLGGNKKMENLIQSPDEQVIVADYINSIGKKNHNITMIHLERPTNDSKFVRPLRPREVSLWTPTPKPNSRCLLIAGLHEPFVIDLNADKNCTLHHCYFEAKNKTELCTHHKQNSTFSGIICDSKIGQWHLTAVLDKELVPFCSSNATKFKVEMWDDPGILYSPIEPFLLSNCAHGYRCKLGKCITWSELCDGKPDCRNGEDETPKRCSFLHNYCYVEKFNCPCKTYEFKCHDGKCINKNLICNDINDCKDGSDEPPQCANFSCATYLNMTNSQKLCDGHIDCGDKSDENLANCPSFCNMTSHFKCVDSDQCIPLEFVCDGERDCTSGEDEKLCWELHNNITNKNQPTLFTRTRGKWQADCLSSDFIDFSPAEICEAKFGKLTQFEFIPGIKTPSAEYRTVKLSEGKQFKLESKPLTHSNFTETCNYVHLNCQ